MVGRIYGMAQRQVPRAELSKRSKKGRECFCYTELHVPDQSSRSLNCFTSQLICATNCSLMGTISGKWGVTL